MLVMEYQEAAALVRCAHSIAFLGNGGNLAIAQHAASDMYRHTGKFCFAPESVSLTALGRNDDWKSSWVTYAAKQADLIIGITTRLDSPTARALEGIATSTLLLSPFKHPTIPTLVIPAQTFHEFEVNALWAVYMIMECNGIMLPRIDQK
jgi:hypothetical protein